MLKLSYTNEENVSILISLLKKNNIKKVIAAAGTTHLTFVGSLQNDPFFEMYSCVDERSAAYMAVGMAAESGEPVVIACTGSTASRNFYPGLTEAYYRKLPILAVTAHQGKDRIGHLIPQNIDRSTIAKDAVVLSVELPLVKDKRDYNYVVIETNKAILKLKEKLGPVHINLYTSYSGDFSVQTLPDVRNIEKYHIWDSLPDISNQYKHIGVFVGSHNKFTDRETDAIDNFCATHNAVVFCDLTSGYYGKYRVQPSLLCMQKFAKCPIPDLDLMIHIGEVASPAWEIPTKEIWRVNIDGELRDRYRKLTKIFQMPEYLFFENYSKSETPKDDFYNFCKSKAEEIYSKLPELPFSNIWIAQQLSPKIPKGSLIHISASNSRRAWNLFTFSEGVESMCNVGCCGIDGCTSTLIGASLVDTDKICFLVTGDLAFFYDLNVLGNRHIGNNVRILLINNGQGVEMRLSHSPCFVMREDTEKFFSACGHFSNKNHNLVRDFAENLGFEYISASNKEEVLNSIDKFVNPEISLKSMIFEIFVEPENDMDAVDIVRNIRKDLSTAAVSKVKAATVKILGDKGIKTVKKFLVK